jgi:hypothetical protein
MKKWFASNFFTSFTVAMNFGRASSRNHCRYTLPIGAFTTIDLCTAFILGPALGPFPGLRRPASPRRPERELSGVEPRVLMFRKRAFPAVSEIETQHVEHEHGVVSVHASSKCFAQRVPEIVLALFDCHRDIFRVSPSLADPRSPAMKQSWDSFVGLKR